MQNSTEHFGEHLTIDGYGGKHELLDNKELILNFMEQLLAKMEMTKLCDIQIYKAEDNQIKDPGGWSAFVVIAESHVSIHTFPKRKFISADVYTCKNGLDRESIISYFKSAFELNDVESEFIIRGKRYPQDNLL